MHRFCYYRSQALIDLRSHILFIFRHLSFLCLLGLGLSACNPQKQNVASRGMQNLTAHYNILYNAKELVDESERNIQLAYADNYDRVISVYKEPNEALTQGETKNLEEAILKANSIANEKSLSQYVDDAYFLIAKANHLRSNFFNAAEFFTYVYNTYPEEKEIRQASLAWKARSLIESDRFEEAEITLDSALKYIHIEKKSVADIYATRAQLHIYAHEDNQAITLLEKAIKFAVNKQNKIRWTYLTAQLQELSDKPKDAYINYSLVVKSNASFEMAFNANLNRISIRNELIGNTASRTQQLRALLKDDKNRDFTDQIYFQIANSYAADSDQEKAIENYNTSIARSTKNVTQKGLTYLKLAEIYLGQSDFLRSKAYYDSTLIVLPQTYPDYELISKKAANLELLADRLTIIAREDTLQMLASLPQSERELRIGELVRRQSHKVLERTGSGNFSDPSTGSAQTMMTGAGDGKFYFNNSIALSQGLSDFKRRWGNRKLEDNWRRSQKSATDITNAISPDQAILNNPFMSPTGGETVQNIEAIRNSFTEAIPLTAEQRSLSDQKIAAAYYDIANYYREVSSDSTEAIKTYEMLLNRFPENSNKLAVYYNLYRLYRSANPSRSEEFKNILLNQYPESPFAKTIIDPDYNQKADEQELAFIRFYNEAYDLYVSKDYDRTLVYIERYGQLFQGRALPSQLAYLKSLATGRTQKLPLLENSFREIINSYPDDQLIVPLVKQHLAFINTNRAPMEDRVVAIVDTDPNEVPFVEEPVSEPVQSPDPVVAAITNKPGAGLPGTQALKSEAPLTESGFFSLEESGEYYFAVNVSDPRVNLSSSRFGVGQFNRINFPDTGIKHQLKAIDNENQLIFVGPFSGREAAASYYLNINPLMRDIMKIPANKYSTFFISRQNLAKINDRETLDRYAEFYKKNY